MSAPTENGLRVGLVVHRFPVISETFVATLAAELVGAGQDVRILATDPDEGSDPVHRFVLEAGLLDRVYRAGRPGRFPINRAIDIALMSPWSAARITAILAMSGLSPKRVAVSRLFAAQPHFDVVHAQFGWSGLTAVRHRKWGTLRTKAIVVHFRGHDVTQFVEENGDEVYSDLFGSAELFIVNSAHFRARAIALGCPEEKIRVIGSPIDTDFFSPPEQREPFTGRGLRLVAVGRLVEKKGFADAVAAVGLLRDRGHNVTIEILGEGPERAKIEADIQALELGSRVRLAGAASRDDVRAALHRADIMIAPSVRSASGDEDAAVNTLKEAMATGLPVVATRHGGIPELVLPGENGLLVPERSPAALADGIAQLAKNPDTWREFGAAGRRKVVEDYDRKVILAQTLNAYSDALKDRGIVK